jgi:signal peptidase II
MGIKTSTRWLILAFAVCVAALDIWTKAVTVEHLASPSHPLVAMGNPGQTVADALCARGVSRSELEAALEQRLVWRFERARGLTGGTAIEASLVGQQMLGLAETGYPAPRWLQIREADVGRRVGDVLSGQWRLAPGSVDALLARQVMVGRGRVASAAEPHVAGEAVALLQRDVQLVPGCLRLVYAENPGAAWGLLARADPSFRFYFIAVVNIVASCLMIWAIWTGWMGSLLSTWALAAVLGGAIGNVVDRALWRVVVDFILMYVGDWRWPVYNVADIGITCGVVVIMAEMLFRRGGKAAPARAADPATGPRE